MGEEMENLMMVWSTIVISLCFCYGTTKLVPKGTTRFLIFLPVLYLFLILPLYVKTFIFCIPTAFFVTWLTSFKLLLLVFDKGPLSSPSLSLSKFVLLSCLPIKLQKPKTPTKEKGAHKNWNKENSHNSVTLHIDLAFLIHYAIKGLIFIFLTTLGYFKPLLAPKIIPFLICLYVYVSLEMALVTFAAVSQLLLGFRVDRPFDHPYLSTSLRDFWGRRWNRVASHSLKTTIFYPILNRTSWVLGRKWAAILALVATFMVSELMHEVIFYYMGRVRFGWGVPIFFFFQGICVALESLLKSKIQIKRKLPQLIIGPLIFVFMLTTFMWLALPELLEHKLDDRVLEEYVGMARFVKDLGLYWAKMGRLLG